MQTPGVSATPHHGDRLATLIDYRDLAMALARLLCMGVFLLTNTVAGAAGQIDGEELLTQRCLVCHGNDQTEENRLAPPIIAVKQRYLKQFRDKDSFVNAIAQWARAPSEDKLLMRGALGKFGLMPALPYDEAELKAIAEYIFEGSMLKPAGFDEHQKAEHGKNKPE